MRSSPSFFQQLLAFSSSQNVLILEERWCTTRVGYKSHLTNEQVIRHDILALQSEARHRAIDEQPNLAFVRHLS